ncbi:MAG: tetratricopeptide repeat protein [Bacteroidales bacterium]
MNAGRFLFSLMVLSLICTSGYPQSPVYDAIMRSAVLRESEKTAEALTIIEGTMTSYDDYRLHVERGELKLSVNDIDAAMASFMRASELKERAGSFGLARIYAFRGDAVNSLKHLEENLRSHFRVGERIIHGDTYMHRIDRTPEWRRFWSSERYSEAEKLLSEVEYLTGRGMSAEALVLINDYRQLFAGFPEYILADALVRYNTGEFARAVNLLAKYPRDAMQSDKATLLMARSLLASGDFRRAVSSFTGLIASEYVDLTLFTGRAEAYLGLKDFRKAIADVDHYLSINPADIVALKLGGRISVASGDSNMALRYLNRVIDANPSDREGYIERGKAWSEAGMWSNAVLDYSMALDLDPVDGELYLNKGILLLRMGKSEQACHDFRMALRYGNRRAAEYINRNCIR